MWAAEEENQLLGSRPRIALHAVTAVTRKPKKTLPFLCRFRQLASRRSGLAELRTDNTLGFATFRSGTPGHEPLSAEIMPGLANRFPAADGDGREDSRTENAEGSGGSDQS